MIVWRRSCAKSGPFKTFIVGLALAWAALPIVPVRAEPTASAPGPWSIFTLHSTALECPSASR